MSDAEWWRGAVIYQVYPRSFADSNGDGIGDLPGLLARLDHLNDGTPRSLGVDALWLSPFYPSPLADYGYDVSDYEAVDPTYGTLADFDRLVAAAHARGLRVLIDLVMNHTSSEHPWFIESRASRSSPRRGWYVWADPRPGGGPPNNWLSAFERCGPAWTFDARSGQYYLHSFTPSQPDLNWRNPAVWAALERVWRFWLGRGVDGFRVDVAHRLMKDPLLRDNPPEVAHARRFCAHPRQRQTNLDLPEVHDVLRALRSVLDESGGRLALGEVPIADERRLARYFGADGMHTAFHVAFWEQPWDATAFRATVERLSTAAPEAWPTYALATHDIPRAATRFEARGARAGRARVAAMMLLTLRGLACIYNGEEIGMTDAPPPAGQELDVDGRDGTRSPMQWDTSGRGFSSGAPWLPFGPELSHVNVAGQDADSGSLLELYRRLIWYRRASPALRHGSYRAFDTSPETFVYERRAPAQRLLVALNFGARPAQVTSDDWPTRGRIELSTLPERGTPEVSTRPLRLQPDEGVIVGFSL